MVLNDLLNKLGLQYEDLTQAERETYHSWSKALDDRPLTAEDIRSYISQAKEAVEMELVDTEEFNYILWFRVVNRKHVGLKARLKNYILLEAFMTSRERAKQVLEKQLIEMVDNRTK